MIKVKRNQPTILFKTFKENIISLLIILSITFPFVNVNTNSGSNGNLEQWINNTNESIFGENKFFFSYGPLYWLFGGTTTQQNVVTYVVAFLTILLVTSIFWLSLAKILKTKESYFFAALTFILLISTPIRTPAVYLVFPFLILFLVEKSNAKVENIPDKLFVLFPVLISIFFYTRFIYGLTWFVVLESYLIIRILMSKDWHKLFVNVLSLIIAFGSIGILVYGSFENVIKYVRVNIELSGSNSLDMGYDVTYSLIIQLLAFLVSIVIVIMATRISWTLFVPALFLTFLFLKVGFGRADHYLDYFVFPTALMIVILNNEVRRFNKIWSYLVLLVLLTISAYGPYDGAPTKTPINGFTSVFKSYDERMYDVYPEYRLPANITQIVGKETIDFYPYNNEYAFANKLNYKHRPVTQSYMTLTPNLGKMNSDFLSSNEAPRFILWTPTITCTLRGCNPFADFDQKYLLNSDPATSLAILKLYSSIDSFELKNGTTGILLERNANRHPLEFHASVQNQSTFGSWIDVPSDEREILFVSPHFNFSLLGKLQNLFYRGDVIYIRYQFENGNERTYRVNIAASSYGIYANYLPENFDLRTNRIKRIMFTAKSSSYVKSEFTFRWNRTGVPISN